MSDDAILAGALADQVSAARGHFAQVFDQVALRNGEDDYLDFKLVALGIASDRDAYITAFTEALHRGWWKELVTSAIEAQVLNPSALQHVAPRLVPHDAASAVFRPQGFDAAMMPWLNAADFTQGLLCGLRRVCEVRAGAGGLGSGFLVGPQTVLTSWHVVQGLMDPVTGRARDGSARELRCRFDRHDGTPSEEFSAADNWLLDWSPLMLGTPGISVAGHYADMTKHRPHALDFAVVRLRGAPGRTRGWYALKNAAVVPVASKDPFFVLQHPAQFALRIGLTDNVTLAPDNVEVRHKAPTGPGSSGGLCLDRAGRLVALHRGEFRGADNLLYNIAVAAQAIAPLARQSESVDAASDIIWRLQRGSHPVIGRDYTHKLLDPMLRSQAPKPILIVRGPDLCGKSFTIRIIEELLGPVPWLAIFSAPELPADARQFAEQILEQAGVAVAKRRILPVPGDGESTDIAWIRDHLFPAFRALLSEAALARGQNNGQLLWLLIDQLNKSTLPAKGPRQFLDTLYEKIRETPDLRIVLLGLDGGLPAGDPANAAEEDLLDPAQLQVTEIERYLACLLIDCEVFTATKEEIGRMANLVLHSARASSIASQVLPGLSAYLMGPLHKVAGEWRRERGL